jgi:hypothetical protein
MLSVAILKMVAEIKLCYEPTSSTEYGYTSTRVLTVEQAEFRNKQSG